MGSTKSSLPVRFCRICWNTLGWQHPSGDAAKLETQSYVSEHLFGHEEWLLNGRWVIDGYHYGFLQPFNLTYPPIQVEKYEVILYTFARGGIRLFVGRIRVCECIPVELAQKTYTIYQRQGWLYEMAADLKRINADPAYFINIRDPLNIINVRFKMSDVEIADPFIRVPFGHKIYSIHRYKPLQPEGDDGWSKIISLQIPANTKRFQFVVGNLKPIDRRERAAQKGVSYAPAHDRFQNSLYDYLVYQHGEDNVGYEASGVDLVVKQGEQFIFYEVKMESTAKKCTRLALGQLLEYAHWPAQSSASRLIIVSKVQPSQDEQKYLAFLRNQYGLPVYYQYFDESTNTLSPEY